MVTKLLEQYLRLLAAACTVDKLRYVGGRARWK